VFLVVGVAFVIITLLASLVFRPHKPVGQKLDTYECGEVPFGPAWLQFRVGYYIYALMFLIFDVEAVFIFPWAAGLSGFSKTRALAVLGLMDMAIFLSIMAVGLVYAWRKGALEWK